MNIRDVHVELDADHERVTLLPSGAIDESEVSHFAESLQAALRSGAQEIDVDLSDVPDMAEATLDVLRGTIDALDCIHGHLCLRNPTPHVLALLSSGALAAS